MTGDDVYRVSHDQPLVVSAPGVLIDDSDPDGDTLTVSLNGQPQNGTVTLNADGSFTYTPDAGFIGEDEFTYTATDGPAITTGTATVTVVNTHPDPEDDAYGTLVDETLAVETKFRIAESYFELFKKNWKKN